MKKIIMKHKFLIFLNFIVVLAIALVQNFQAILFKTIVDSVTGNNNYSFYFLIVLCILFLISLFLLESFSKIVSSLFNSKIMTKYKQKIINAFISDTTQNKVNNSEIISILNNDVNLIEENYLKNITSLLKDLFLFVISLYLLFRINIYLTIVILLLGWIPVFIPQIFTKKNKSLKDTYSNNTKDFISKIKDVAQGFEVIKGFNIEDKIKLITYKKNSNMEESKFKSESFVGVLGAISITSGFGIFFINLMIAGYFVIQNQITVGSMIAAVQLMNYVVNPLISISRYTTSIKSVSNIIKKIDSKFGYGKEIEELEYKFKFNDQIRIENLSYSYDGDKKTLSNINLNIEKGRKYAIVGESGCGKSTLMKILLNQINDYNGKVFVDDVDVLSIDLKSFYKNVSLIHQNVFIFNDSIRNNVCLYNDFSENALKDVIEKAGLKKVLENKSDGIDTLIGEDNSQLSGGESQRISIARALIKDSSLLLVDEATSSLDNITGNEIEDTLMRLDRTVIAIIHRLDKRILSNYDEIIVMKDGMIIEIGSFEKLVNDKNYFYYLYNFKK